MFSIGWLFGCLLVCLVDLGLAVEVSFGNLVGCLGWLILVSLLKRASAEKFPRVEGSGKNKTEK